MSSAGLGLNWDPVDGSRSPAGEAQEFGMTCSRHVRDGIQEPVWEVWGYLPGFWGSRTSHGAFVVSTLEVESRCLALGFPV